MLNGVNFHLNTYNMFVVYSYICFGICKFILTIYRFINLFIIIYALIVRILPSKEPIAYCTTTENKFKTISTTRRGQSARFRPMRSIYVHYISIDIDWVAIALFPLLEAR